MRSFSPAAATRRAAWVSGAALLALLLVSGCAMQQDMMEMQTDVTKVQDLQSRLDAQILAAGDAAARVKAMEARLDTFERRLNTETNTVLNEGLPQAVKRSDDTLRQLREVIAELGRRVHDAEQYFLAKLAESEGREQQFLKQVAGIAEDSEEIANRAQTMDALSARLETVERLAARNAERVAAPEDPSKPQVDALNRRLTELEAGTRNLSQEAAKRDQLLANQFGQAATQLSQGLAEVKAAQAAASADDKKKGAVPEELVHWLQERVDAGRNESVAALSPQITQVASQQTDLRRDLTTLRAEISAREVEPKQPAAEELKALADRVESLETATRNLPLEESFGVLTQRVRKLEQSGSNVDALVQRLQILEMRAEQLHRVDELTRQLAEIGRQVTERVDAQQSDFDTIGRRLNEIETKQQAIAVDLFKRIQSLETELNKAAKGAGG
ncbi:MAG: hypothetical protein OEW11_10640 [Nitrospirota bacterium]|nr:hypothetical protein [Nitrospirota bacterium]